MRCLNIKNYLHYFFSSSIALFGDHDRRSMIPKINYTSLKTKQVHKFQQQ